MPNPELPQGRSRALFRVSGSVRRDPAINSWLRAQPGELGTIARHWFVLIRELGDDVREVMHDGQATACIGDAAFAYVAAFAGHVNVGFFRGAELPDPAGLLVGKGKSMRHVKLEPARDVDDSALMALIEAAYADMKRRVGSEEAEVGEG